MQKKFHTYIHSLYTQQLLYKKCCLSRLDERPRQKLVREAAKGLTAKLKEQQEILARTAYILQVTSISCILHMSWIGAGLQEGSLVLVKDNIWAWLGSPRTFLKVKHGAGTTMVWSYIPLYVCINWICKLSGPKKVDNSCKGAELSNIGRVFPSHSRSNQDTILLFSIN